MNTTGRIKMKAPIWDLVGLVLTRDRRLLIVVPVLAAVCYLANRFLP